jgi:rhodanese-related sulfurtransferase
VVTPVAPPAVELAELLVLLASGRVRLVEALGAPFFADAHLPGAVNMPLDRVDELAPVLLPDKQALVVVYCSDLTCPHSAIAARRLVDLGYTDVRTFPAGKQAWAAAGHPLEHGT